MQQEISAEERSRVLGLRLCANACPTGSRRRCQTEEVRQERRRQSRSGRCGVKWENGMQRGEELSSRSAEVTMREFGQGVGEGEVSEL